MARRYRALLRDHLAVRAPESNFAFVRFVRGPASGNPAKDNYHREGDLADASEAAVRDLLGDCKRRGHSFGAFETPSRWLQVRGFVSRTSMPTSIVGAFRDRFRLPAA